LSEGCRISNIGTTNPQSLGRIGENTNGTKKGNDMGLDMYLYAKKYVSNAEYLQQGDAFDVIASKVNATGFIKDHLFVEGQVAYWRKANAIHNWFINLYDSEDDGSPIGLGKDNLEELQRVCAEVISNPKLAEELLPTASGFFFGSTEYDEWYFGSVQETHDMIDNILKTIPDEWSFEYQASW
jgi:hypothetical protein